MIDLNLSISIISLKVEGLNTPVKRQKLSDWINQQSPTICDLQETYLKNEDTHSLKVKGWKKIRNANTNQRKAKGLH